jgi:ethanolamine utilization microcompartment shell protein EutS
MRSSNGFDRLHEQKPNKFVPIKKSEALRLRIMNEFLGLLGTSAIAVLATLRSNNQRQLTTVVTAATTTATLTAATTATAAIATATAATALFTWLGFVDRQRTTIVLLFMKRLNGGPSAVVFAHFDESEALAATRFSILDHFGAANFTELRKQLFQI